jgi:hypothetical protein
MVSEPEATCLSLLKTLQPSLGEHGIRVNSLNLIILRNLLTRKPGNSFLVCDAGGGTVVSRALKAIMHLTRMKN